jgi:hypothetical protein
VKLKTKRILGILLSVGLLLGGALPVLADGGTDTGAAESTALAQLLENGKFLVGGDEDTGEDDEGFSANDGDVEYGDDDEYADDTYADDDTYVDDDAYADDGAYADDDADAYVPETAVVIEVTSADTSDDTATIDGIGAPLGNLPPTGNETSSPLLFFLEGGLLIACAGLLRLSNIQLLKK